MSTQDLINASFEFGGSIAIFLSILQLRKDKAVAGISWYMIAFFTLWGAWNVYFYPHLGQTASFLAGILVLCVNVVYLSMLLHYSDNKK